jgi:hypothetical protein
MPAELVPFTGPPDLDRRKAKQLHDAVWDDYRRLHAVCDVSLERINVFDTLSRYTSFIDRRLHALERACRRLLTSDALSDAQRAELHAIYAGTTTIDLSVRSNTEIELIAAYRRMDTAGRQMLRALMTRLAASNEATPPNGAAAEKGGTR